MEAEEPMLGGPRGRYVVSGNNMPERRGKRGVIPWKHLGVLRSPAFFPKARGSAEEWL
jgi:hypothetical protein